MSTGKKGVSGGRSGPLLDINSYQIQPPGWAIAQTLAVQGKSAWAASAGKDVAPIGTAATAAFVQPFS